MISFGRSGDKIASPGVRGDTNGFAEKPCQMGLIGKPADERNLGNGRTRGQQEALCEFYPALSDELGIGQTRGRLEGARKIARAQVDQPGNAIDTQVRAEVVPDEILGSTDLPVSQKPVLRRLCPVTFSYQGSGIFDTATRCGMVTVEQIEGLAQEM